jgi:hypothetical protein
MIRLRADKPVARTAERTRASFGARPAVLLACAAVAMALAVAGSSAAPAPVFTPARTYETGDKQPGSIAIGDLNADGRNDLVTSNDDTVSVLLNGGQGRFGPRRDYAAGPGAGWIAIGDLSGDARPDLATLLEAGMVCVFMNLGDGRFNAKVDYPTGAGPSGLATGDLNGDGKLDLVTGQTETADANTVSVLLNSGDGTFDPRREYVAGEFPQAVAVGDLNGMASRKS